MHQRLIVIKEEKETKGQGGEFFLLLNKSV